MDEFKLLEKRKVYSGHILDLYNDKLETPKGVACHREYVVRHGHASAIVPIDPEGNIVLVKQYRHPVESCVLEIPAGMLEAGEDPKEGAIRELEEEIGYKAKDLTFLCQMHSAVGICNEIIYIYLAEELSPGVQHWDEDEVIELVKLKLEEAVSMIFDGKITDSKTISGILAYKEYKQMHA